MEANRFDGVVAFMGNLWGRELGHGSRAAGWKMLQSLPDAAVEKAIEAIAESGREHLPPWPLVYKTAEAFIDPDAHRALPAGDGLSDQEHTDAMVGLRARQTPEQRRRSDRVVRETKGLPMKARCLVAQELLTKGTSRLSPGMWDALADETLAREFQLHSPLVPAARADLA